MNHKQKIKLARSLRTSQEIRDHVPLFDTAGWKKYKDGIKERVQKQQAATHERAMMRKQKIKELTTNHD